MQLIRRALVPTLLIIALCCLDACSMSPSAVDNAYDSMSGYTPGSYTRTIFSGHNF